MLSLSLLFLRWLGFCMSYLTHHRWRESWKNKHDKPCSILLTLHQHKHNDRLSKKKNMDLIMAGQNHLHYLEGASLDDDSFGIAFLLPRRLARSSGGGAVVRWREEGGRRRGGMVANSGWWFGWMGCSRLESIYVFLDILVVWMGLIDAVEKVYSSGMANSVRPQCAILGTAAAVSLRNDMKSSNSPHSKDNHVVPNVHF